MRLHFLTLIAMMIPAAVAAAEPKPLPGKASSPAPAAGTSLLQKKLAELKALQAEIRQLRQAAGTAQQLLIDVQILEVSPKPSQRHVGGIAHVGDGDESTESLQLDRERIEAGMVLDRDQLQERLAQWREKSVVRVVAEPKIVTVSGRPAQFQIGGMIPILDKANHRTYQEYGTRVDVVAITDEEGSLRLELRARQSCLDDKHAVVSEGQKLPGLSVQEIDTAAKLLPEQVLVVGTFTGSRSALERSPEAAVPGKAEESGHKVAFMVLVKVDLVDGISAVESEKSDKVYRDSPYQLPSATVPQRTRRD